MNCKVCENTSVKNAAVSFFRFPKENTRCKDWASRCNLLHLYEKHGNLRFYKSFRICSDHFEAKDIVFDGRKNRLLQSAVPKIFSNMKNSNVVDSRTSKNLRNYDIFKHKVVENLCRLCAEENKNLTDIFGWRGKTLDLETKLKYFPLVVDKYDVLPLRVCHQCISKVNQFCDFINNCIKAETKLKLMLDLENCDTTCKIIKSDSCLKQNINWNTDLKTSLNMIPIQNFPPVVDNSYDTLNFSSETITDNYISLDQVLEENFTDSYLSYSKDAESLNKFVKKDSLNEQSALECGENKIKLINTNDIKDLDYNTTVKRHYSNMKQELSSEQKINTESEDQLAYFCDICLKSFTTIKSFNTHSKEHFYGNEPFNELLRRCDNDHIETPAENLNKNQTCDKKFHKVAFLQQHSLIHNVEQSYNCSLSNLRPSNHQKKSEKRTSETFFECFPSFEKIGQYKKINRRKNSKFLKIDIKQHNSKVERRCQFCDERFNNGVICFAHEQTHTGETPYKCKQCGKKFRSRQSLRQHKSVHSDERLFTCQECGTSFKRKDTLRNHLRIHTGERPFVCKICGFAFKQRGDCIKHEKNHKHTELQIKEKTESVGGESRILSQNLGKLHNGKSEILSNEEKHRCIAIVKEMTQITDTLEDIVGGK